MEARGTATARFCGVCGVLTLSAAPGGATKATLITVSGKQYEAPPEALQIAALGG